ncbi:eIF4G, partial [Aphelenchoides avenae]
FIAELYRHFLITDTIIQWCSVHLIKTYEETKDDVYIEYAAHMIERVGPAFEARKTQRSQAANAPSVNLIEQVMTHFMQIKDTLSNRVRFMILNLDELRKADWKSQRFAREQGPKTIQEVHQEAKEEEIQNRVERDAYERNKHMEQQRGGGGGYGQRNKQYGGRPSNDYRQQQPRAPDDRRSQAAAAAMSSGSGLRKDISLKQADNQSEKLGVKSGWAKGAGGGGQSSFFSKQQQKKPDASRPTPSRSVQDAPNRDGSQPGSREQSESRGGPRSADRKASLASKGGSEDRSSTPDQSSTGGAEGARGSPAPVQSPPPPPVDEKKVAGAVRATIDEYSMDVVTIDEAFETVNDLCQRTSGQVVFKKFFAYGGESVKPSDDNMRRYIGQIICKCLQADSLKEDAIKGFAQYCTEAVEQELSCDCPGLWKNIARIIGWSMFCHPDNVEGSRPHLDLFTPVFKAANEESPKQFSVLIQVLQMM